MGEPVVANTPGEDPPRWTVALRLAFAWGPLNIEDGTDAEAFVRWAVHRELAAHGLTVASVSAVTRHAEFGTPEDEEVEILAHMGRVISALRGDRADLLAATEALRAWLYDHDTWPDWATRPPTPKETPAP